MARIIGHNFRYETPNRFNTGFRSIILFRSNRFISLELIMYGQLFGTQFGYIIVKMHYGQKCVLLCQINPTRWFKWPSFFWKGFSMCVLRSCFWWGLSRRFQELIVHWLWQSFNNMFSLIWSKLHKVVVFKRAQFIASRYFSLKESCVNFCFC